MLILVMWLTTAAGVSPAFASHRELLEWLGADVLAAAAAPR